MEGRVKAFEPHERMIQLGAAQRYLKRFVENLERYEIVPAAEQELYEKRASDVRDPAKRRELKINQWKKEREIRAKVEVRLFSSMLH